MFKNEDENLKSLKKKDRYHFSIPFEYIKKNLGNDSEIYKAHEEKAYLAKQQLLRFLDARESHK